MDLRFQKFHGTGNDFILIDNRTNIFNADTPQIAQWCNRHTGIGADGLILLQQHPHYDFQMVYFNADGNESTMCGNGGRCIVAFAYKLGVIQSETTFMAIDGVHQAFIQPSPQGTTLSPTVRLKMNDVNGIQHVNPSNQPEYYLLDTGSPHYVQFVSNIDELDVQSLGRSIRNSAPFQSKGVNVNFIQWHEQYLQVRTYERGVEDETLSCGTGVTAAALVAAIETKALNSPCAIKTIGGELKVYFNQVDTSTFNQIWLEGPASFVFEGIL